MAGIYITSSERGAGKTAVAASLASLLKERGESVGYFKPVALIDDQWASDHDTAFCRKALDLEASASWEPHTERLDTLSDGLPSKIRDAVTQRWAELAKGKHEVVIEGLSAVGATATASRDLAEVTDARVLAVVRYRRGIDLDEVTSLRELFDQRFIGVILNAVPRLSARAATEETTLDLAKRGVPVLGSIPEDRLLMGFTVDDYRIRLHGRILDDEDRAGEIVESLLVGAMVLGETTEYYGRKPGLGLITRADRPDLQWNAIELASRCLILTGGGEPIAYVKDKASSEGVPVIVVNKGTLDTIADIEAFVTAPTFHHMGKLARFKDMLREHVDLSGFGLQA